MPIRLDSSVNEFGFGPEDGKMAPREFRQARREFMSRVLFQNIGKLNDTEQYIDFHELEREANKLKSGDRFIAIHFGLDGRNMVYGFSFREGRPNNEGTVFEFDVLTGPSVILRNGRLDGVKGDEWSILHNSYVNNVKIRRGDTAPSGIKGNDGTAVVLQWEREVALMYGENTKDRAGVFKLCVIGVSVLHDTSDMGNAGYRHGVAFYCIRKTLFGWKPMLKDKVDIVLTYKNKAADYGNLCPPRCGCFTRMEESLDCPKPE